MRPGIIAILAVCSLSAAAAWAQSRNAAARLSLVATAGVAQSVAAAQIAAHRDAVDQCVRAAREEDPVGFDAAPAAHARLRINRDGGVTVLELEPSNLARGLSACLAADMLAWHFDGVRVREAAIRVEVRLAE